MAITRSEPIIAVEEVNHFFGAGALRKHVKKSLLESAAFVALPVFIVVGAEIDDVFARYVSWTTWRREHLALHRRFHFAGDLHQKFFPNASWFCVFVGGFE